MFKFTAIITLSKADDFDKFDKITDWCDDHFKDFNHVLWDVKWMRNSRYENCTPWEFSFNTEEDRTLFLLTWC